MRLRWRTGLVAPLLSLCVLPSGGVAETEVSPIPQRARDIGRLTGQNLDLWEHPALGPYAPKSPGDPDLGEQLIVAEFEEYRPLNFLLAQRSLWTDNAALTDDNELSDFYSDTELRLSYMPSLAANTYGEFNASYSFFRYADHSFLDFDSIEASVGAIHVFRSLSDLSVWSRYNYNSLLTGSGHDEFFRDHSIELGLYYPIPLGIGNLAYFGYNSEFSIDSNPDYSSRHEHAFTIGYSYSATDRIELGTYYRFYVHDYHELDRTDLLHTVGLSLTTRITERLDLLLAGSYSLNDSDARGGDYEVGEAGAIIGFSYDF